MKERRNAAIVKLINNWRELVRTGEMGKYEMIESLQEQVDKNCQGWDMSLEELDLDPTLGFIMGYDIDYMTDEQVDEWEDIVDEAARIYLSYEK